jgi:drug/metabolite transporter (DMT)-like permease
VFWFGTLSFLYSLVVVALQRVITEDPTIRLPCTLAEWNNVIIYSLMGALADYLLTQALQIESAALVSMARGFDMVTSFVHQALYTNDHIYVTSIYGAVITVFAVVSNAWIKYNEEKTHERHMSLVHDKMCKELQIQPEIDRIGHANPDFGQNHYVPTQYPMTVQNELKNSV